MKKYVSAGIIGTLVGIAPAKAIECRVAVPRHNSTISDLRDALNDYERCLRSSQGTDDCARQFRNLKGIQSDFETVVSDYQDCRP
jgi:hypothetical protein